MFLWVFSLPLALWSFTCFFSMERYMKGKSLYSQMFVLPSKACKGSLAWADFFLKSCNYSWKEKKSLSLIGFLVLLVTVFIIPFYIIFYWWGEKKLSSAFEREKVIVLFSHLPMLVAFLMCLKDKDAENYVIDGITMATVL